jgi:hypothetical protein
MKAYRFLAFLALLLLAGCGTHDYAPSGLYNASHQSDLHLNLVNIKTARPSLI